MFYEEHHDPAEENLQAAASCSVSLVFQVCFTPPRIIIKCESLHYVPLKAQTLSTPA